MARSKDHVPGEVIPRANPNVYHRPKHTHWAKKAEPQRHHANAEKTPARTDEALQRTSRPNNPWIGKILAPNWKLA